MTRSHCLGDMNVDWNYPTGIHVGRGRVQELPSLCAQLGITAPLLVTDYGLADLPMTAEVIACCQRANLKIEVFSAVKPNPNGENVDAGVAAFRRGKHDGVIAFGGGSSMDVGKCVALMARQNCEIWQLEDIGDNWQRAERARIVPTIAIPTTAGTGSEVGRAALIVNQAQQRKVIIFHPNMLPERIILDAELTVDLPPSLTAATGMDALSHNLEAYCSHMFHPMAEGIAIEGMRLIKDHLPNAVANGNDIESRSAMLVASCMGATAFQRGLGAMHALAHPLGALYDAHHGTLNAILMPFVLSANRSAIESRIARLAQCLDLRADFDCFLEWVLALRRQINIPHDLQQIGIDAQRLDEIADMAVVDPSAATNPIAFDAAAYRDIAQRAVSGNL